MKDLYDYQFPEFLIAQKPASPRDSAKLLIYNRKTKETFFDTFLNLPKYLPKNAVLVFNNTKVIPARFEATKPTGGKITILYTRHDAKYIYALIDKPVTNGAILTITKNKTLTVKDKIEREHVLTPNFKTTELESILEDIGHMPLPPYIKNTPLSEKKLRNEYQTIFAKNTGSVAAPTASLHFTKRLLKKITNSNIQIEYITLHVGLGTFASVTDEQIKSKTLHKEYYEIPKDTASKLNKAKKNNQPIIAVGTTSVRTLESASNNEGQLTNLKGTTELFIQEGYNFKFVDNIITNFHVPKSSLLILVSSFCGREETLNIYNKAIKKDFKLFSFGDGMLIK